MINRTMKSEDKTNIEEIINPFGLNKKDVVYYARILPSVDIYEILELNIRTVEPTFFVGTEKDTRHAYLFGYSNMDKTVFRIRNDALEVVKEAERHRKVVSNETFYEEN